MKGLYCTPLCLIIRSSINTITYRISSIPLPQNTIYMDYDILSTDQLYKGK